MLAVLVFYLGVSAWYTWPLLRDGHTLVASDPGDPILNASILWWDATTWPFSQAWWNAPHYYPSEGIAAFTESLVGLTPTSAPVLWATGKAQFDGFSHLDRADVRVVPYLAPISEAYATADVALIRGGMKAGM